MVNTSVAVVVPVLYRPQAAVPFIDSLFATVDERYVVVYPVADVQDSTTVRAWIEAGAAVEQHDFSRPIEHPFGPTRPGTFAEKVNRGYRRSWEPWIFITGDDVRFHVGWLDEALAAAQDTGHVIGVNDMVRGDVDVHSVHMLVRRSYVDDVGGGWDGPGILAHEGYWHWYTDDEIVHAARQRGVYRSAPAAIVEHMHPAWGKGVVDDVYRLGNERAGHDHSLFIARSRDHAS